MGWSKRYEKQRYSTQINPFFNSRSPALCFWCCKHTDVAITAPVFQIRIDKSRDRYHTCSQGIIFEDTEVERLKLQFYPHCRLTQKRDTMKNYQYPLQMPSEKYEYEKLMFSSSRGWFRYQPLRFTIFHILMDETKLQIWRGFIAILSAHMVKMASSWMKRAALGNFASIGVQASIQE